jgi:hypothetical protein
MVDTGITAQRLSATWLALGRRTAAAAGASAALVSLIYDTPLWVASLRGTLVWVSVLVLARAGRAWVVRSLPEGQA